MIELKLSVEDVNRILAGLGELPAKASLETIVRIREQAAPQLKPEMPENTKETG